MALGGIVDPLEEEERETKEGQSAVILEIAKFEQKLALNKSSVAGGLDWMGSEEAKLMGKLPPDLTGEEVIYCFETLRMPRMKIDKLDLENFQRLQELDISGNRLGRIEGIPWSLQVLNAYDCQIEEVGNLPEGLLHLGLGYNRQHSSQQINAIIHMCPELVSLDLSYNSLCDFDVVLNSLKGLKKLKHLYLTGNPLALAPNYRLWVLKSLEGLEVFDDIAINPNKIEDVPAGVELASSIKIKVALDSIQGIRKPPAKEEGEEGEEETAKVTYQYYAQFTTPMALEQQSTAKVQWAPTMQTDWKQEQTMKPSISLRDGLLFSGVDIEVYEEAVTISQPIDGDEDAEDPQDEDPAEEGNQPESTVKLVGKVHLDLEFMLDAKTTDQGKLASFDDFAYLILEDEFQPTEKVAEPEPEVVDKKKGKGKGKGKPVAEEEQDTSNQPASVRFTFSLNAEEPAPASEEIEEEPAKGKKGKTK